MGKVTFHNRSPSLSVCNDGTDHEVTLNNSKDFFANFTVKITQCGATVFSESVQANEGQVYLVESPAREETKFEILSEEDYLLHILLHAKKIPLAEELDEEQKEGFKIAADFIRETIFCQAGGDKNGDLNEVRKAQNLCTRETGWTKERRTKAHASLAQFSKENDLKLEGKNIALCTSGGGVRAYIGAHGFIQALKETKAQLPETAEPSKSFLDCVMYGASLSGSSWIAGPWAGQENYDIEKACTVLDNKLLNVPSILRILWKWVGLSLASRLAIGQFHTIGNFYAAVLHEKFGDHAPCDMIQTLKGIQNKKQFKNHDIFMPIFTAITKDLNTKEKQWLEFSPFEIGCQERGAFIDPDRFGVPHKINKDGVMRAQVQNFQHTIMFLMAIWGSAFNAELCVLLGEMPDFLRDLRKRFGKLTAHLEALKNHISPPKSSTEPQPTVPGGIMNSNIIPFIKVPSFMDYSNKMVVADAGIHFNIPLVPLLVRERAIVFDISAGDAYGAWNTAQDYCNKLADKLPEQFVGLPSEKVYVTSPSDSFLGEIALFKSEGKPSVVYISVSTDLSALKFHYTKEEALELHNKVYHITRDHLREVLEHLNAPAN